MCSMLSIIIPTLNEEEYISYLLGSIKWQTFRDYEIIVADAGSKDKTVEIAQKEGCSVVRGGLPSFGRNKGVEASKGNLFLFLDADVVLPRDFLEDALIEFNQYQLDIASCFVLPLSNKKIDNILYGFGNLYYGINQYLKPQAPGYCILVKKDLHLKINGFDEKLRIAEDWDYVYRASKLGEFKFLRNVKIPLSMRRFERDGRLNVTVQRTSEALSFSLGGNARSINLFKNYRFGYYPKRALEPIIKSYKDFSEQVRKYNK